MKEQDTLEILNVTADCRKKKCDCEKNSPECKLRYFTANCDMTALKDRQPEKPRLKHCVIGRTKDELIKAISSQSDRYGDKLLEFMDMNNLICLKDATVDQLQEYISTRLCPQEREVK